MTELSMDELRWMLVSEIKESYGPLYPQGGSWQDTADFLYAEEPEHMERLTESLRAEGWREPISLTPFGPLEEDTSRVVEDGTHRMVIALSEGVLAVPVVTDGERAPYEESPWAMLTVEPASQLTEDESFRIFDVLRSFPLDERRWLNSDGGGAQKGVWDFPYRGIDESNFPLLLERAKAYLEEGLPGRRFILSAAMEHPEA